MGGEQLARRSLRLDALYCLGIGTIAVFGRRRAARVLGVPEVAVVAAGVATVAWAGVVARVAESDDWRSGTRLVSAANAATGVGLVMIAKRSPGVRAFVLGITGLKVLGFAASQAAGLARR